ncbi:MAG: CRISPR-associated helicase Cas3' [Hyphomicrobiaceae bacterium]
MNDFLAGAAMRDKTYLCFWGKAQGEREGEPAWHPNAYHSLDVAAVAGVLLETNPRSLGRIAHLLDTSTEAARNLLVALIALHDIGKFSAAFQAKVPAHYPNGLPPWPGATGVRHDRVGSQMLKVILSELTEHLPGWKPRHFGILWNSIAGHHGCPRVGDANDPSADGMTGECQKAARSFAIDCLALFPAIAPISKPDDTALTALSWTVAGLTVVADWIGSNRDWIPYRQPDLELAAYWPVACDQAASAVANAGLLPAALPPVLDAERLLPSNIASALSPLQSFAATVDLPRGPMLAIIEDVTGSGKTEAALLLAARIMKAGGADGVFFALPTMATANAMYARLADAYRKLFADDAAPSLVLAHGRQGLHAGFQNSILTSSTRQTDDGKDTGNESGAACAAWIADSRRKAFLAHVGVGTLDQALLGVLPSKFQSLRLWGLAGRVLVIDEAHAYDSYMSKEIETLLSFHAALGGSAIILSATLPQTLRRSLASAFARGLGFAPKVAESCDYPLMTIVGDGACAQHPVATREDRKRVLPVRRIGSIEDAMAHVASIAEAGGAVAWIRNSVDDAVEAVEALEARGLTPVLLHARFAMGDRLDIEKVVTDTLGQNDRTGKRCGFVLVGTQILEQSLDYDVDGMIVDLAPIDLMIQRAGRLWRHTTRKVRPVTAPQLLVLSPDPSDVRDKDWCRQISRRSAAVYDHHGIVWRSAKTLFDAGHITTPEGVRALVEQVYASDALDGVPDPLSTQMNRAEGQRGAARAFANANLLKFAVGYAGSDNQTIWTQDTITPTRLGQPVTVFRLGYIDGGKIIPLCSKSSNNDPRMSWSLSEVSIARYRADGVPATTGALAAMVEAAKAQWSPWERDQPLLVLERDGERWRGVACKTGDGDKQVRYCNRLGLRIVEA